MKVLVTGTAGFIGFHLAQRLLRDGHIVVGLDNLNDYYDPKLKVKRNSFLVKNKRYHFHKVDIADSKKVDVIFKKEKPQLVIHLAAQAGVRYSLENPWVYNHTNNLGTLSIFEGAKNNGVKKIMYASSSSVYGTNTKMPFSEDDRTDTPISLYAATKKANEHVAHAYHYLFGLDMIGFRFFTVYGPWGRPDMAFFNFVKNIQNGTELTLYNKGHMWRSFTYVGDIVDSLMYFVTSKEKSQNRVFNIGGDHPFKVADLVKEFEKALGKKAKVVYKPMHKADVVKTHADTTKLKKATGKSPKTPLSTGLKEFTDWYLDNEKWLNSLKKAKQ